MAEHNTLIGGDLHEPKGADTATAGSAYISDGAGAGTWDEVALASANVVAVNGLDDFPTPAANIITLAANCTYLISGAIDIGANRLVFGLNTGLKGFNRFTDGILSTTGGSLITASESFLLESMFISAPSASIFNLNGSGGETVVCTNSFVASCNTLGSINNWRTTVFRSLSTIAATTTGLLFTGSCTAFNMDNSLWSGFTAGTMIDFDSATFDRIQITGGNRFVVDSGITGITASPSSGNFNPDGRGQILDTIFEGAGTLLNGITNTDLNWNLAAAGVPDTGKNAQGYNHTASTTTISGGVGDNGNPTLMDMQGNFVTGHADQFTIDSEGRITYIGLDDGEYQVRAIVNGTVAAGTNQNVNIYIAINGVADVASMITREYASGSNGTVTSASIEDLVTGDYIEVYVENLTSTNNWISNVVNVIAVEV